MGLKLPDGIRYTRIHRSLPHRLWCRVIGGISHPYWPPRVHAGDINTSAKELARHGFILLAGHMLATDRSRTDQIAWTDASLLSLVGFLSLARNESCGQMVWRRAADSEPIALSR